MIILFNLLIYIGLLITVHNYEGDKHNNCLFTTQSLIQFINFFIHKFTFDKLTVFIGFCVQKFAFFTRR